MCGKRKVAMKDAKCGPLGLCKQCLRERDLAERQIAQGLPNPNPDIFEQVGSTAFRRGRTPEDD